LRPEKTQKAKIHKITLSEYDRGYTYFSLTSNILKDFDSHNFDCEFLGHNLGIGGLLAEVHTVSFISGIELAMVF